MNQNSKLVLKNGQVFNGITTGFVKEVIGQVVFNTSMVGYQEIITDKAYSNKIVVLTYPLIGNYGVNGEDSESTKIQPLGIIAKEVNDTPSNFRFTKSLNELLEENETPILSNIDTRKLTKIIRDNGQQIGLITSIDTPLEECLKKLNEYTIPTNQVEQVSTCKKWVSKAKNPKFHVLCLDLGVKSSLIKQFNDLKCNVTILPYNTKANEILKYEADGLFISNGPGNPYDCQDVVSMIKEIKGKLPILGINLGHLLVGLSYNLKVDLLPCPHMGSNHAVKNLSTGKLQTVSKSNEYTVLCLNDKTDLKITYQDASDKTIDGLSDESNFVSSVQFNPEITISPINALEVFDSFINNMMVFKGGKKNA